MTTPAALSGWLEEAALLQGAGTPFVLATVVARERPQSVRSGSKAIIRGDGSVAGWVGGGCVRPTVLRESLAALADGRPRLIRINPEAVADAREDVKVFAMTCEGEGSVDVYLEPVVPRPEIVVFGRTLVAEAIVRLAGPLELRVRVVDAHADAARFPGAAELLTDPAAATARISPRSYVVVATMGEGDDEALRTALSVDAAYVGLVASPKKAASLLALVRDEVAEARIGRVKAPAGLDFGAVTPAEIALSVLAEIVQHQRAGTVGTAGGHGETTPAPAPAVAHAEDALTAVDPVCGMGVEIGTARHSLAHDGRTFYFCCPHCRAAFQKDPARYLGAAVAD